MHTVSGTWELWDRRSGGTSESNSPISFSLRRETNSLPISFLIKDAHQDIAGQRLKA